MVNPLNSRKILLEYGKKHIELGDLITLLKGAELDAKNAYGMIAELCENGLLEPVKNSGTNGNRKYPLHRKYRITVRDGDGEVAGKKKMDKLHPMLLKSGYLSAHPEDYEKHEELIGKLNSYLFSGKPGIPISRKERSFEIFGREKTLDDSMVKTLLRNLQISEEDLSFYDTPEYCFHDYIPERKDSMTLLICENKDIWFNIRRCMFEDGFRSLFGIAIDGVVYGNGNKISQKEGALSEYVRFMGNPGVSFLYWGDIDREGFDIYRRTKQVNPLLRMSLFVPGYRKMIERAQNIEWEDSPSSKKEDMNFEGLFGDFTTSERDFLKKILTENKLIPQEIISYIYLSER